MTETRPLCRVFICQFYSTCSIIGFYKRIETLPLLNNAKEIGTEATAWRQHLHQIPELQYDVFETAKFISEKLKSFGCDEVTTGIGRTGIVAIINGNRGKGDTIGLRADMDALPMTEITGLRYASKTAGKMHACGHDGHSSMLLGAAKHLCETRNFAGSVALIFQPAEEGGAGGKAMVDDGMMDRFNISRVFGMHNLPGLALGSFAACDGAIMAAADKFDMVITGRGGHAALPHQTIDPIVAASQIVTALQSIVSRNTDPLASLVISVTKFHAGDAYNIIPQKAEIAGTVRTLQPAMRDTAERRIRETAAGIALACGVDVEIDYQRYYPVTFNHTRETELAMRVARDVAGTNNVNDKTPPTMGAEDFSFMLEARPGAFIFMGNGDSAGLHHPAYNFNDEAIAHGVSYWVTLVETALA
jgi:amidohydrolase